MKSLQDLVGVEVTIVVEDGIFTKGIIDAVDSHMIHVTKAVFCNCRPGGSTQLHEALWLNTAARSFKSISH